MDARCAWGFGFAVFENGIGVGGFFFAFGGGISLFWLFWPFLGLVAYGVGLSLCSYRFISVPPVRGGTYFSLPAAKKSRQKKAAPTANS